MKSANARRVSSVAAAAVVGLLAIAALVYLRTEPQAAAPSATSTPTPTAPVAQTAMPAPIVTPAGVTVGSVTGRFGYPSDMIPALALYALPVTNTADGRHVIVRERWTGSPPESQGGGRFTMSLPAGTYYFVAYSREAPGSGVRPAGGYTQFVTCGSQRSCGSHALLPVSVTAGQTVSNIDITDWFVDMDPSL